MQKIYCLIIILLVIAIRLFPVPVNPVVLVLLPESLENNSYLNSLGQTIFNTISFTLRLMGKYTVIENREIKLENLEVLADYARQHSIDNIIFGNISRDEKNIIFEMSVYDRLEDRITITVRDKIEDIFKIFDAIDSVSETLIEGFSGIHVGFGSLNFINTGEEGDYNVYIDDDFMGKTINKIEKIFIGEHRLNVSQQRMLGTFHLFDKTINITEDASETVFFSIPYLTAGEEQELHILDQTIYRNWDLWQINTKTADSLGRISELLNDVSYCKKIEQVRMKYFHLMELFDRIKNGITADSAKQLTLWGHFYLNRQKKQNLNLKEKHNFLDKQLINLFINKRTGSIMELKKPEKGCYKLVKKYTINALTSVTATFTADTGGRYRIKYKYGAYKNTSTPPYNTWRTTLFVYKNKHTKFDNLYNDGNIFPAMYDYRFGNTGAFSDKKTAETTTIYKSVDIELKENEYIIVVIDEDYRHLEDNAGFITFSIYKETDLKTLLGVNDTRDQ